MLIVLVLLQSGSEGMGVIFGGSSSSLFGSTGAGGVLAKLTTFAAVIFVATCLSYNIVSSKSTHTDSIIIDLPMDDPSVPADQSLPLIESSADPSMAAPEAGGEPGANPAE